MSYSLPFAKINVAGHFGATSTTITEQWMCGFHITKNGGVIGGSSEMTAFLTAIRTPIQTFHTNASLGAGAYTWLDEVNGAYIGTDGKYVLGSLQTTTRVAMTAPVAGTGTGISPWTQANVLSLRSLLLRGPASHGRIYWPAQSSGITQTTGVIAGATVSAIATAAKTLLDAINTQAATSFGSGASVGLVSNKGTGFQSPVVKVGVGQKLDHMESRERKLSEAHVFQTTALAAALLAEADDEFRRQFDDIDWTP